MSILALSLSRLREHCRRGVKRFVRVGEWGGVQWNAVLWAWYGHCHHDLTAPIVASTKASQPESWYKWDGWSLVPAASWGAVGSGWLILLSWGCGQLGFPRSCAQSLTMLGKHSKNFFFNQKNLKRDEAGVTMLKRIWWKLQEESVCGGKCSHSSLYK